MDSSRYLEIMFQLFCSFLKGLGILIVCCMGLILIWFIAACIRESIKINKENQQDIKKGKKR